MYDKYIEQQVVLYAIFGSVVYDKYIEQQVVLYAIGNLIKLLKVTSREGAGANFTGRGRGLTSREGAGG